MTSITKQKIDLKAILCRLVMARYDDADPGTQRSIAKGLLSRLMATMTLRELQEWHQKLVISKHLHDVHRGKERAP